MAKSGFEVQKELDEIYRTGSLDTAWFMLEDHFDGELEYVTAAQDIITLMNTMANEKKINPDRCAEVIEGVIDLSRDNKALSKWRMVSDARYALRTLAENPEFAELGYTQSKIEELARNFNRNYADNEYRIRGFSYTCPKTKEVVHIDIMDKAA